MAIRRDRVLTGPLNHRQREILKHVADGKPHAWIAEELEVSRVCISENMRVIVCKLDVPNSQGAVALWSEYASHKRAAQLLERHLYAPPVDPVQRHVNHVLEGIARILHKHADSIILPL